ncbi:MAG TPA: ABC transporter permease subunit [Pseudomonas sp.]|jgi:polar amino acid transport system permease protein|uniref:ABC transporter permease n=1 Tax=Pseudomonas sp. TaxID=306 RepID=UPI002BFEB8C4|nr:ABC transporter permease subunit [Pseudomonas sp.]HRL92925.1 ABC transporter permease subunit [Pseudomonas sp.]
MEWLNYLSFSDGGWGDELLSGLGVTLSLAVATLPVGLLLGLLVAAITIFGRPVPRAMAVTFTTTIRGLPELLTLFIIYHGVGLGINSLLKWYSPQSGYFELSPFLAGVLALGMVFGGYASEVLRGAWQALDHGQLEAAQALGVRRFTIFRLIELPQMLRLALPGLGNLWINLLKDTALVSVIALNDLMRMANVAVGTTKKPFVFFLTVCLIYWAICILFECCLARMEKRANRGLRAA